MNPEPTRNTHNRNFGRPNPNMARPENESAKKSPPWLECYNLDSFSGVDDFMKELLKLTWTGDLGTRQSADCLGILRLLLERRYWLPSGNDKYNPETHRLNDPWPGGRYEERNAESDSPLTMPDESEITLARVKELAKQLKEEQQAGGAS